MIPQEHIELLKVFIGLCKSNPAIIHDPKLAFFADYLKGLGASFPEQKQKEETPVQDANVEETYEAMESDVEESDLELDNASVVEPDVDMNLPMGDNSVEVTEDMMEKADDERSKAMKAFADGNYSAALEAFTAAIKLNPGSTALHAKRASVLLLLKKPNAAIKDCNKALEINPDSAQAYKFRGRANMLLGKFEEAHSDLATACKLDYDDQANAWLKDVEPNYKKIFEHKRKHERKLQEKEDKRRQERRKKAQEAYEEAKTQPPKCEDDDCGGCGADASGLDDLFSDPEIMTAFQDPEVMAAFADVSQNPMNMFKYQNNPKVKKVLEKLGGKMGAKGGGVPGAFFQKPPTAEMPKAKPDIDID